jgi:hypothetical protein
LKSSNGLRDFSESSFKSKAEALLQTMAKPSAAAIRGYEKLRIRITTLVFHIGWKLMT